MAAHIVSNFPVGSADWSKAYLEYLARSTAQSAKALKLYQQVLEGVSHGHLAPTVFQDHYLQFTQTHWPKYASKLAQLNGKFLSELVGITAAHSQEQAELAPGNSAEPDILPPQFDAADAARWSQQLAEYAGQLSARALKAYRAQLDRIVAGETTPSQIQDATSAYLSNRLPDYLQRVSQLFFDLLSDLNNIRAEYEEDYFLGMLATANRVDESQALVLNLTAPLGETTVASLEVENFTEKRATIRYSVTEVRRTDGVGPAFDPKITITPETLDLGPGEQGNVRLSLRLDETDYDVGALYSGTLFIAGQAELPVEVLLRIIATPSVPEPKGTP
ncbi:MAG: hypothetical protein V7641_5098 [Blastocatellia bacterium]